MNEQDIEQRLQSLMQPVAPRQEFVRGLERRIHTLTTPLPYTRAGTWYTLLLLLAGLILLGTLFALAGHFLFSGCRTKERT